MTQQNTKQVNPIDTGYLNPENTKGKSFGNLSYLESQRFLSRAIDSAKLNKVDEANTYLKNFTELSGIHHTELKKGWLLNDTKGNISLLRALSQNYNLSTINRYRDEALKRGDNFTADRYMELYKKSNYATVNEESALETSEFLESTLSKITRSDSVQGITDIALSKLDDIRAKHLYGSNNLEERLKARFKELDNTNWAFSTADRTKDFVGGVMSTVTGLFDLAGSIYSFISGEPNPIQATNKMANAMNLDQRSWAYFFGNFSGFLAQSPIASATMAYRSAKAISGMDAVRITLASYLERGKAINNFIQAGLTMITMHGAGMATSKILENTQLITNENRKKALPDLIGVAAGGVLHWATNKFGVFGYSEKNVGPKKTGSPIDAEASKVSENIASENRSMFGESQTESTQTQTQTQISPTESPKASTPEESLRDIQTKETMNKIIDTNNLIAKNNKSQLIDSAESNIPSIADAESIQNLQNKINEARSNDNKNFDGALLIEDEINNLTPENVIKGARNASNYSRKIETNGRLQELDSNINTDITVLVDKANELVNTEPSQRALALQDKLTVDSGNIKGIEKELIPVSEFIKEVIPTKVIARLAEKGGITNADMFRTIAEQIKFDNPEMASQLESFANSAEIAMGYESKQINDVGLYLSEMLSNVDKARAETLLELTEISPDQIDLSRFKDENYRSDIVEAGLNSLEEKISAKFNDKYSGIDNSVDNFFRNNPNDLKTIVNAGREILNRLNEATKPDVNNIKDYKYAPFIEKISNMKNIPKQEVTASLINLLENGESPNKFASNIRDINQLLKSVVRQSKSIQETARQRGGLQSTYVDQVVNEFSALVDSAYERAFENEGQKNAYKDLKAEYSNYARDRAAISIDKYNTKETTQFNLIKKNPKLLNNLKSHLSGAEIIPGDSISQLDQLVKASVMEKVIDVGVNKDISVSDNKSISKHISENRHFIEELYGTERFKELSELGQYIDSSKNRLKAVEGLKNRSDAQKAMQATHESLIEHAGAFSDTISALRKSLKSAKLIWYYAILKGLLGAVMSAKFALSAFETAKGVIANNKTTRIAKGIIALESSNAYKAFVTHSFANNIAKNNGYINPTFKR